MSSRTVPGFRFKVPSWTFRGLERNPEPKTYNLVPGTVREPRSTRLCTLIIGSLSLRFLGALSPLFPNQDTNPHDRCDGPDNDQEHAKEQMQRRVSQVSH